MEKRADADREESRCLGAQKDLRIAELEAQVRVTVPADQEGTFFLLYDVHARKFYLFFSPVRRVKAACFCAGVQFANEHRASFAPTVYESVERLVVEIVFFGHLP